MNERACAGEGYPGAWAGRKCSHHRVGEHTLLFFIAVRPGHSSGWSACCCAVPPAVECGRGHLGSALTCKPLIAQASDLLGRSHDTA